MYLLTPGHGLAVTNWLNSSWGILLYRDVGKRETTVQGAFSEPVSKRDEHQDYRAEASTLLQVCE